MLGCRFYEICATLRASGFVSFQYELDLLESFGTSAEVELHRELNIEIAKELLGNTDDHSYLDEPRLPEGYRSPLLGELRAERFQRTGRDFAHRDASKPWEIEIDPCRRTRTRLALTDPKAFAHRAKPFKDARRVAFAQESGQFGADVSAMFGFDADERARVALHIFGTRLRQLGFEHNKRRSNPRRPTFLRSLPGSLIALWYLDPVNLARTNRAAIDPRLEFRHRSDHSVSHAPDVWVTSLPFWFASPLSHLFNDPYGSATSAEELATCLRAYMCALAELAPDIFNGNMSVLVNSSAGP